MFKIGCNQTFEFVGDTILQVFFFLLFFFQITKKNSSCLLFFIFFQFLVTAEIFKKFPNLQENSLSQLRSSLVCNKVFFFLLLLLLLNF